MKVFVTVGTTQFDSLVHKVCEEEIQTALKNSGYTWLVVQAGKFESDPPTDTPLQVTWYKYKPSIKEDMTEADLIISHAGAGTCLEALELGKPLIVVVNDQLMGNHQIELAERLAQDNHLVYATPSTLLQTIQDFKPADLAPYTPGDPTIFSNHINKLMNITV